MTTTMTTTTRCKFTCMAVKKSKHYRRLSNADDFLYTAEFMPVTGGSTENDSFFDATPSGKLEIGTYTDDRFEVGKDYYLDIVPVED